MEWSNEFSLYAMECEGLLDTRQSQLYRISKEIANRMNRTGEGAADAMDALGYNRITDFTIRELEFIQNELTHLLA